MVIILTTPVEFSKLRFLADGCRRLYFVFS